MKRFLFAALTLYAGLGSVALAASGPSVSGYGGEGGETQTALGGFSGQPPTSAPAGETLPFTGLDLGVLVAVALVLLAVGFGLRRVGGAKA